jgi:DNA-directed RNA polymerase subunit H (RpoH/RPB5)
MDYLKQRPLIKTGDPIQWKSKSAIGAIIRWWTKSKYNHTAMAIRFTEYDTDRVFIIEAMEHGLQLRALSDRLESFKGEVWHLPLIGIYDPVRHEIGRSGLYAIGRGVKYDYRGCIFGNIKDRASKDYSKLFCSEFWYMCIESVSVNRDALRPVIARANVYLNNEAPTPADIPNLGLTKNEVKIL